MKDFRQLRVWEKAHAFVRELYNATSDLPQAELYGITAQVRRAAVSIPSNIAEGCGRAGDAELARYCQIAMGSASEVEYQLLLARDLNFLDASEYVKLEESLIEVKRMLNAFISLPREDHAKR